MLAEARQQGTLHPTSSHSPRASTGYRQGAAVLLLSFQQEVMALDLRVSCHVGPACELPCWPQRHIVDHQPLEPFESRSSGSSGSTRVFKERPLPHMHLGQVTTLNSAIEAVTCWSPYAGQITLLIWFGSLLHEGLHVYMIINDAIKWSIYPIIHVIPKGLFTRLVVIIRAGLFLYYEVFLVVLLTASVKADATYYLLGSAMILIPKCAGKHLSSAGLITLVISSNLSFTSSDPRKPPLISSRYRVETRLSSHDKDTASIRDGVHEGLCTATSHMEADTDDINI